MRTIKFVIQQSGAPYPDECWWKIIGSNGRIYLCSELMNLRNARKVVNNIIEAISAGRYRIDEISPIVPHLPRTKRKK